MKKKEAILLFGSLGFLLTLGFVFDRLIIGTGFLALVCRFLAALVLGLWVLDRLKKRYGKAFLWVRRVAWILVVLGILVVAVTEGIIIYHSFGSADQECEYVVILGCMVRPDGPSKTLQNRIDAAAAYLKAHPGTIAIASGGQGPDEPMTEARCIYEGLVAQGIDPGRIWLEERATSTWTNLQYSLEIIRERTGEAPGRLGILSSEFHLFRASLQAKDLGLETPLIPAKTTVPVQALNHFLREIAGVWHYILLGGQI